MPRFSNQLPTQGANRGFDLRRTPTTGNIHVIVTCEDFVVCDTHFWHGRTTPCERIVNDEGKTLDDSHCPSCLEKQAWRSHVYVSVFDPKKQEHFIWECTAQAAKPIAEYRDTVGSLRGCVISANRPKGTPNGRVIVVTGTANLARNPIPQSPDLTRALAVIWRIPATALEPGAEPIADLPSPDGYAKRRPTNRINGSKMRQMREQTDNAADPTPIADLIPKL